MQAERDKALDAMHPAAMGRAGYWFHSDASDFSILDGHNVTGAKPVAEVEILLAPTRVGSIQPDCDHPG
jgi:hypothetical protein